jgi:oligopeptide/dipeptide ABC transporter ATP-binding protein
VTVATSPLLAVEGLRVNFYTSRGVVRAVQDASFTLMPGAAMAIVGESGSGKSVTALALMDLISVPGRIDGGTMHWRSEELTSGRRLSRMRGRQIAMVFQDPMTSLNPLMPVGRQITEVLRKHKGMSRAQARARATELLDLVGIPHPGDRLDQFPHELSGGLRQRVMIAMALASEPDLLIADEPTTALDVTIQAQILELLAQLRETLDLSLILITHDLGVVAGICDEIAVMYAGRIVERGRTDEVFKAPAHPYTAGLIASTPRVDKPLRRLSAIAGSPPGAIDPPPGCAFAPRCPRASDRCVAERPERRPLETGREVACWHEL